MPRRAYRRCIRIGRAYIQLSQPGQTIPWLERALNQDSESLAALHQMGETYRRLDRLEEAAHWWRCVLQVDPDHRPAQERLHEIGMGPEPQEPLPSAKRLQMLQMMPVVKARMRRPQVHRVGGVALTWDYVHLDRDAYGAVGPRWLTWTGDMDHRSSGWNRLFRRGFQPRDFMNRCFSQT